MAFTQKQPGLTGHYWAEIGMKWGEGIKQQGMPFENFMAKELGDATRLPPNFPVIDNANSSIGVVTSVKTLNTMTPAKLNNPEQVYYSLKSNVDVLANAEGSLGVGQKIVDINIYPTRNLQAAIPASTTPAQWIQIQRVSDYANSRGVNLFITVIK